MRPADPSGPAVDGLAVALALGLLLGVVDLAWLTWVPSPWYDLGDSGAIWVVAAWWTAARPRSARPLHRIAVALAVLLGAVTSFYAVAVAVEGVGGAGWWSVVVGLAIYGALGAVGGLATGVAAVVWRGRGPEPLRALGLAAVPALLVGEAVLRAHTGEPGLPAPADLAVPATMVLVALAVLLGDRAAPRRAALAAGLTVPLAAVVVLGWDVVGIGGT